MDQFSYHKTKHLFNVSRYNEHGEHEDCCETGELFKTEQAAHDWAKVQGFSEYSVRTVEEDYGTTIDN